jgi:hypothetical protein
VVRLADCSISGGKADMRSELPGKLFFKDRLSIVFWLRQLGDLDYDRLHILDRLLHRSTLLL